MIHVVTVVRSLPNTTIIVKEDDQYRLSANVFELKYNTGNETMFVNVFNVCSIYLLFLISRLTFQILYTKI